MVLITGSDFSVTCTELAQLGVGKRPFPYITSDALSAAGFNKRYVVLDPNQRKAPAWFNDARCANGHAYLNRMQVWLTKDVTVCETGWSYPNDGQRQPLACHVHR